MRFVDEAEIVVQAGSGGNGCASFHRDRRDPLGGPDGASGGDGGDVMLQVDPSLMTLMDFRYRRLFRAGRGGHGSSNDCAGRNGEPCMIPLPAGTTVYDAESGEMLADLVDEGRGFIAAAGGKGGRGNSSFATSTRRAPRCRELGKPGERRKLKLVLRLLADVGIIGMPNTGKSTLLARISNAKPKIAEYPFTTLSPNLGTVEVGEMRFTAADLPGLVEGAAEGKGLGHRFLRHVERAGILLHLVAPRPDSTPARDYELLRNELTCFNPSLLEKAEIVVLNKVDTAQGRDAAEQMAALFGKRERRLFAISALDGEGLGELLDFVSAELARLDLRRLRPEA